MITYLTICDVSSLYPLFFLSLSQELQRQKLGRMQESDYFEDFGEGNNREDYEEEEVKTIGKKAKGSKSKNGKDKLMGELEQLALGVDGEVQNVIVLYNLWYFIIY